MDLIISIQSQQSILSMAIIGGIGIIGTILGAIITYLGLDRIERRKIKKKDHEKRLQVYTLLTGKKEELFLMYASFIQACFQSVCIESMMKSYRPDDIYMLQSIRDDFLRQNQLGDTLIVDIAKSEGNLTERLSLIQYLFNDEIINKKILNIIYLIKASRDYVDYVRMCFKQELDSRISVMGQDSRRLDSKSENWTEDVYVYINIHVGGNELQNITDRLYKYYMRETIEYIITNVMESIDDLLADMKNEI